MIPTYVLNASSGCDIIVVTRELDADRVEIMWITAADEKRVGKLDWSFRSSLDNQEWWTRVD
jgi:hypothetical protein